MYILIRWRSYYALNIKEIDQHNRKFVDIVNSLNNLVPTNSLSPEIELALSDLVEYSFIHFKTEERYYVSCNTSDSFKHIDEHRQFAKKINKYQKVFSKGDDSFTPELLDFLKHWFRHHILCSDRKLIQSGCLQNKK
ncbi:MAG TPA: hemerythrin family protein [Bacteroidales bacterium]